MKETNSLVKFGGEYRTIQLKFWHVAAGTESCHNLFVDSRMVTDNSIYLPSWWFNFGHMSFFSYYYTSKNKYRITPITIIGNLPLLLLFGTKSDVR